MQDLNDKSTGDSFFTTDWNPLASEIQNVIEALGQTLTNADLNQLGKSIAGYIASGRFYTDSGSANTYVLTQIGSKQALTSYTDGSLYEFIADNANAAGVSIVNAAGLGIKNIVNRDGNSPEAGEISGLVSLRYSAGNDNMELQSFVEPIETVSNHIRCGNMQLYDGSSGRTNFEITAVMAATTFESIGPTGAGSDNTWTELDQVPANASGIIVNVDSTHTSTLGTESTLFGYFVHPDASTPAADANNRSVGFQYDSLSSNEDLTEKSYLIIPINSANEFLAAWSATNSLSRDITLIYQGFITD